MALLRKQRITDYSRSRVFCAYVKLISRVSMEFLLVNMQSPGLLNILQPTILERAHRLDWLEAK